jgi:CRISPR-associated endonuclease Csn1
MQAVREKLDPHDLGRVLFHLATRRGFLSNRKTDKTREASDMLQEISELQQKLDEQNQTLGEYLNQKLEANPYFDEDKKPPVRQHHTRRSMYESEFNVIWEKQREFYPDLLTDELKYGHESGEYPAEPKSLKECRKISKGAYWTELARRQLAQFGLHGLIFFQRKMYWPRSVVGQCELTREDDHSKRCKRKRCPKANRSAQKFRILQEVNNLKVYDAGGMRRLTDEERAKVVESLLTTKQQTFKAIRKKLKFHDYMTFNIERGGRDKLKGHETDSTFSSAKCLGKSWKSMSEEIKNAIVDICIFEEREEIALKRLQEECALSLEESQLASSANLVDGYMHFCQGAIDRLIPFLEQGLMLMANDETDSALHAAGYLRPDQRVIDQKEFLPESPDLPNPIVRQALIEVRKVVNAIIREHGKPDRIHIELAREAKKSFEERREIRFDNSKREKMREQIAERLITDFKIKPSRNNINRYVLWKEQEEDCLYCGKKISQAHFISGDADIDHILPRWRSLDDSMGNKVISHRWCNQEKKDQTPAQWLKNSDSARYEQMIQIARKLDNGKRQKLEQMDIKLDNFVARQLTDTTYIATCVRQYLECLGVPIVCPRGGMTKDLRHWWGLNNILDLEKKGRKNRNDHRHHAIDAIVIAMTDHARLQALANARGENMPPPWPGFLNDTRMAVLGVNVSYRVQRKISGALHEATFYGVTQKKGSNSKPLEDRPWAKGWIEDDKVYVRRKPIESIDNAKHLAKVRDEGVREILKQHLIRLGIDPDGKKSYPKDAFKGSNTPCMPNKKNPDQPIPIKKVRMVEEGETFMPVSDRRDFQYVKPGNNHHIVYWAEGKGETEKWSADVVTTWEAAKRACSGGTPIDHTPPKGKRFVMSLSIGEMFEMIGDDGEIQLCVVRKMDQRSKRVYYKKHTDARETEAINKDNLYLSPKRMQEVAARKVTVDPLGRVRWAND